MNGKMTIIREIVLDTETTGLEPAYGHRIIEIGAIELINKVETGKKFHHYINPERDIPKEAYAIHGISEKFLQDKPKFEEIVDDFLQFIEDTTLVIHNAPFDIKFLNHELGRLNKPSLDFNSAVDTLLIARKLFPGSKVSLDALCRRFKVDNSSRKFHGALLDAQLLADIYVEMLGGRQEKFIFSNKNKMTENNEIISTDTYLSTMKTKIIHPNDNEQKNHKMMIKKIANPKWSY
jgi:DNA polymerase-3 subunit epsilon